MASARFDLVVIGAGPGGYVAALRAAELGMHVACVDKGALGGTCLNVGCIPSKALLESSERYYEVSEGFEAHGIRAGNLQLDLGAMMARKSKIVQGMTQGIGGLFKKHKVEFFAGTGSVPAAGVVRVDGKEGTQRLQTERTLLALGSAPAELPSLPFDGEFIISSTEALELPSVPDRLVVIGAGAIGLEMGSVWNRLGSDVLVVEYMDSIIPGTDTEITALLERVLKKQGLTFKLGTSAEKAEVRNEEVRLTIVSKDSEEKWVAPCDCVLVAVGRRPFRENSEIEALGVEVDERGFVVVDAEYQTTVAGVYAIGDLIPGPMLAHKAEAEGVAAVELMAGRAGHVNYNAVPNVVYTNPEVASVGMTEADAEEAGHEVKVGKYQFRANARAHCMDSTDGLVKIVADASTDRVLGMHILGPQASHLIAEGVIAMEFAASAEDIARTIHAHPSLSEVIKEAAWSIQE